MECDMLSKLKAVYNFNLCKSHSFVNFILAFNEQVLKCFLVAMVLENILLCFEHLSEYSTGAFLKGSMYDNVFFLT